MRLFTKEQFGIRLKGLRQKRREAQNVLGALLGVSTAQISDIFPLISGQRKNSSFFSCALFLFWEWKKQTLLEL